MQLQKTFLAPKSAYVGAARRVQLYMLEGSDMKRIVFSFSALLSVLMFALPAQAQNINFGDFVIENLCDPEASLEFIPEEYGPQGLVSGLDSEQLDKVRIELLERGFDPGFDPNRDNTIDAQLQEALVEFQTAYELPVTGQTDIPTLVALSFPTQQLHDQIS
jgi:hypothetical protein